MSAHRKAAALTLLVVALGGCASRPANRIRTAAPSEKEREQDREREREGGPPALPMKPGTPKGEVPMADWFIRQRQSGDGVIPDRALSRALEQWKSTSEAAGTARVQGSLPAQRPLGALSRGGASDGESAPLAGAADSASDGASSSLASFGPDAPGTWTFAGPNNIGGRITTLGIDPTNSNTIWLGSADGGVWRSTDGGVNWSPRWTGPTALSIGALVIHPTNGNIVYVGTGEDNGAGYSYDGEGVFKTTDGGATWSYVGLAEVRRIGKMAIDPTNGNKVFVAAGGDPYNLDANRGIYRTTDGGANWQKVLFVDNQSGGIDVAIDPTNPQNVFAATWTRYGTANSFVASGLGSRVYKSSDGGTTWAQVAGGLPVNSATTARIGLAIAKSNSQIVYAWYSDGTGSSISHRAIYKTTNGGTNWAKADTCNTGQQALWKSNLSNYIYYFGQIRVDPNNAAVVYLMDVDFYKSTTSACWFNWSSAMHSDHHDLTFSTSTRFFVGGDGGFWSTTDGTNFTHATTIGFSQFYDLGIDPNQPLRRFGGLQDNYVVRTISGGLNDWEAVIGGDGLEAEVDPTNSNNVYGESQYGNIYRSTDGGANFDVGYNGIGTERTNWKAPLTHDPVQSQKLYTGTTIVYRTTDGALNWFPFSPNLTNAPAGQLDEGVSGLAGDREFRNAWLAHLANVVTHTVSAIAVSPVSTNIVWAGTDDGNLWVDTNGDGTWSQRNIPAHTEWVTRIAADPFDANAAYVTLSGFRAGNDTALVFRTTNLGVSWTNIGTGLPVVPLNDVYPDPAWRGRLFVATDLGVYVTDDWGATWSAMNGGLPVGVVQDLDMVQRTQTAGTLFAGTFGRSLWTYNMSQLPPPDRDGDGIINVDDCAPDDAGSIALPAEVQNLQLGADRQTLTWNSAAPAAGSGTVHQVLRGLLTQFPVGSGGEICLVTTPLASATDTAVPTVAQKGFRYLVRGKNTCGSGSYGNASSGAPRTSAACP